MLPWALFCYRIIKIYMSGAWNKEDVGSASPWRPQSLPDPRCLCRRALQGAVVANGKYICKILDPTQHNCLVPLTSTTGSVVSGYITCGCGPFQHRWFGWRLDWLRPLLVARRSDRPTWPVSAPAPVSSRVFIQFCEIHASLIHLSDKWTSQARKKNPSVWSFFLNSMPIMTKAIFVCV